jgi:trigger factor
VDHQAQHMIETFTRNIERQGIQLPQYLRLIGKDQDAFEAEMRTEAESRVRRSLALDAFASAEKIDASQDAGDDESRSREMRALARLVEVATGNGRNGGATVTSEKTAELAQTSDTGRHTSTAERPAAPAAEEHGGTA